MNIDPDFLISGLALLIVGIFIPIFLFLMNTIGGKLRAHDDQLFELAGKLSTRDDIAATAHRLEVQIQGLREVLGEYQASNAADHLNMMSRLNGKDKTL